MSNTKNNENNTWNKYLEYTAAFLGIISTGLGIFISINTISINEKINELQKANLDLDKQLKGMDVQMKENALIKDKFDNAVRLESEFKIFNANAFASNYREKSLQIMWLDNKIQQDIEKWLGDWINYNRLMTGSSQGGLFARQIVCLRIINAGNILARKIKVIAKQANFDNISGKFQKPYYEVDTNELIWQNKEIEIGDLAESSQKELLKTQMLIPLAHISGSNRYFGQVIVPLELTWHDERKNTIQKISIDIKSNSALKNELQSSMLGVSKSSF